MCINTNGTLLKKDYADMLLDSKIDYISLDCDAYSKEVFESIRIGASRDSYYSNVEYLLKEKTRRNSNIIIDVKTIEMEQNKGEIKQVLEYWQKQGAWTAYRKLSDWGNCNMMDTKVDFGNRIACGHAVGTCAISWDGYVAGCAWDGNCDYVFGNVQEESIQDIWKKRNEDFVKKHLEHRWDELPDTCQKCNTWKNIGEERFNEKGIPIDRIYDSSKKIYD